MSTERRYSEEEIAAIFKAAADEEASKAQKAHAEGLTLSELQEIGAEAGMTPDLIARAASAIDRRVSSDPATTIVGIPISVSRSIELSPQFTDADWDRLVVDLRETFQATGKTKRDGSLREWRNGNLHALVEPTENGYRLRIKTLSGNGRTMLITGLMIFLMNLGFMLVGMVTGKFGMNSDTMFMALLAAAGLGGAGLAAVRLPRWRTEREGQMEGVLARAGERAETPMTTALPGVPEMTPLDLGVSTDEEEAQVIRAKSQARLRAES